MGTALRHHRYVLRGVWCLLGLIKGLGMLCLAVVWLACLASFGLWGYAQLALPLPDPASMYQLGWTFGTVGLSLHLVAWLPPFPQCERLIAAVWKVVRHA